MIDKVLTCPSVSHKIWLAGDRADAQRICREFCLEVGLCVTVTETVFVFTGGAEAGVVVGVVNYPRFPETQATLEDISIRLALRLRDGMSQLAVLVEGPADTYWFKREILTTKKEAQ